MERGRGRRRGDCEARGTFQVCVRWSCEARELATSGAPTCAQLESSSSRHTCKAHPRLGAVEFETTAPLTSLYCAGA